MPVIGLSYQVRRVGMGGLGNLTQGNERQTERMIRL